MSSVFLKLSLEDAYIERTNGEKKPWNSWVNGIEIVREDYYKNTNPTNHQAGIGLFPERLGSVDKVYIEDGLADGGVDADDFASSGFLDKKCIWKIVKVDRKDLDKILDWFAEGRIYLVHTY